MDIAPSSSRAYQRPFGWPTPSCARKRAPTGRGVSAAVFFVHQGVTCLLPARQVVDREARGGRKQILLWELTPPTHETTTTSTKEGAEGLLVHTPHGIVWLPCDEAELRPLERGKTHPLPALVASALELPHLVGVVELETSRSRAAGGLAWMVDLRRYREPADATRHDGGDRE